MNLDRGRLVSIVLIFIFLIFLVYKANMTGAILGFVLAFGTFSVLIVYLFPVVGFFALTTTPFIVYTFERYFLKDLPLDSGTQAFIFLLVFLVFIKSRKKLKDVYNSLNHPLTYITLFFYFYGLLQAFNPNLGNINGWLIFVKGITTNMLLYILIHFLCDSKKFVQYFFNYWLVIATISALYGCYQEWHGYNPFELRSIHADPHALRLIYVGGRYRIFSLLGDPASFGTFMGASFLIAFTMLMKYRKLLPKILFGSICAFIIMATGYSGTRTAYAMIIGGLMLFSVMSITNKRMMQLTAIGLLALVFLLFGPIYGNPTVNRFRSLLNTEDESLNVRDDNRAHLQNYIYANPIGGGVLTTGLNGERLSPDHELAGFPTDSGYVLTAVETGWVGLVILMISQFMILFFGVKNFYFLKDIDLRYYSLAIALVVMSICVASYAQSVEGRMPMILMYSPIVAILSKMSKFDSDPNQETSSINA